MSTQQCQRSRTLATEVYKVVNGMTPNYIQELFEVIEISHNLRNPTGKIITKSGSTTYGLKSLTSTVNHLNETVEDSACLISKTSLN